MVEANRKNEWYILTACILAVGLPLGSGLENQLINLLENKLYLYVISFFVGSAFLILSIKNMEGSPLNGVLYLLLSLLFMSRVQNKLSVNVFGFSVNLQLLFCAMAFLAFIAFNKINTRNRVSLFATYIGLTGLSVGFQTFDQGNFSGAKIFANGIIPIFIFFLMCNSVIRKSQDIENFAKFYKTIGLICILYGIIQPIIYTVDPYWTVRVPSIYYNPIPYACFLVMVTPFFWYFENSKLKPLRKICKQMTLQGLGLFGILQTGSRSCLVIYIIQVAFYALFSLQNFKLYTFCIWILLIALAVLGGNFAESYGYAVGDTLEFALRRFQQEGWYSTGASAHERVSALVEALRMFTENPVAGVGLGRFREEYYNTESFAESGIELDFAHSFILNQFAEQGIVFAPLALFLASQFFSNNIKKGIKINGCNSDLMKVTLISSVGFFITLCVVGGKLLHVNSSLEIMLYIPIVIMTTRCFENARVEESTLNKLQVMNK